MTNRLKQAWLALCEHPVGGYMVDPVNGIVYGRTGRAFQSKTKDGYVRAKICIGRLDVETLAHRAIWQAVNGPIPAGMQINHINGIKDDNRINNLELVTPAENTAHAAATGLRNPRPRARLTERQVMQIRRRFACGERRISLAQEFLLDYRSVDDLVVGRTWKHLPLVPRILGAA